MGLDLRPQRRSLRHARREALMSMAARDRRRERRPNISCGSMSPAARRNPSLALRNLEQLCEDHLPGRYRIEVIDLLKNPQLAKADQILAVPDPRAERADARSGISSAPWPIRRATVGADLDLRPRDADPFGPHGERGRACLTRSRPVRRWPRPRNMCCGCMSPAARRSPAARSPISKRSATRPPQIATS